MHSLKDKLRSSKRIGINPEYPKVSVGVRTQVCLLVDLIDQPRFSSSVDLIRSIIRDGFGEYMPSISDSVKVCQEWDTQANVLASVHNAVQRKIENRKKEVGYGKPER